MILGTTETDNAGNHNIFGGHGMLESLGGRAGMTLIPTDPDGAMRRVPYEMQKLKSLGFVAAEVASGRTIARPPGGKAWIDYAARRGRCRRYSYLDVFRGRVPASAFDGKVVVVGVSAPSLGDLHNTSVGDAMSGPRSRRTSSTRRCTASPCGAPGTAGPSC